VGAGGAYFGGKEASKGTQAAANTAAESGRYATDAQMDMYRQSRADTEGQRQLFGESLPYLRGMAFGPNYSYQQQGPSQQGPSQQGFTSNAFGSAMQYPSGGPMHSLISPVYNAANGAMDSVGPDRTPLPTGSAMPGTLGEEGQYVNALSRLDPSSGMPGIPGLQSQVNIDLENDPIYKLQAEEMTKQLNRRYGAQGRFASSGAEDAMSRNLLPFMQDSYSRNLDTMNRENQNALTTYGLGYQQQGDTYGRNSSRLMDLYNMQSNMGDRQYGRVLDMAKIGSGAAQTAGQNAMATGQGIASTYMNQGNTLANLANQQGQNSANMIGGMAGAGMGAANNYMLYNMMQG
jgi:hypothetical protein